MKSKLINNDKEKTFAVILQTGDEAVSALTNFAKVNHLKAAHFTAIGAFKSSTIAFFEWQTKKYQNINIDEQVEVLSMIGDIALDEGSPKLHVHVVLGKSDGTAHGGHLVKAIVRPTLEIIINESPDFLQRKFDAESGLALINPDF